MDTVYIQLCVLFGVLVGNAVAGYMPCFADRLLSSWSSADGTSCKKNRVIAFFIQFGGGLFMSICLLVLVPQSRMKFELAHTESSEPGGKSHEEVHREGFPIPEFVMLCSYFATFAVEEALHHVLFHCRTEEVRPRVRFCSCAKRHTECSRTFKAGLPEDSLFQGQRRKSSATALFAAANENTPPSTETDLLQSSIMSQPLPNYGTVTNVEILPRRISEVPSVPTIPEEDPSENPTQKQNNCSRYPSSISTLLLWIPISLYSAFQGVATGMSIRSDTSTIVLLLGLQQVIIHLTVGNIYFISSSKRLYYVYVALSAIMAPLGIAMSMFAVSGLSDIPDIILGGLSSAICGCLLYVTFNDLLRRHCLRRVSGLEKLGAFCMGSSIMALLQYLPTLV